MKKTKTDKTNVRFSLKTPKAKEVFVLGDFNQWDEESHPLKCTLNGVWEKDIALSPGRYEYKYVVDGQWKLDPNNNQLCSNSFGTQNNIILVK